jgi:uncharacterized protein
MAEPRPVKMSLQTARRLAVTKQHLDGRPPKKVGTDTILKLVLDLNYVQLDPTMAVAPNHLLVLWSRLGSFRESDLDSLLWKDKKLFEYWAHMASIVLTEDYPLYLPRMKKFHRGDRVWDVRLRSWMKENSKLRAHVLAEIRSRGPLASRDIEEISGDVWLNATRKWGLRDSAWGTGGGVPRMLQFLFHDGTIMVAGRRGRQKLYDLTERFLPPWTPKTKLTDAEVEYTGAQRSLKALGVGTPKQIAWHFLVRRYQNLRSTVKTLVSDSKLIPVELTDAPRAKGPFFIHADDIETAEALAHDWEPRTTLLSPFDNLVTDKERTLQLFGFLLRNEIYTPKEKRVHGFFVLPILDGDRLIGRIDPYMDRENERLVINAVHAEPGAPGGRAVSVRIAGAIESLADFLGAKEVVYPRRVPVVWAQLR